MKHPRDYLNEIQANLQKLQSQGQVSPTDNALFGMVDGLAGLLRVTLERVTLLEEQVRELRGTPMERRDVHVPRQERGGDRPIV